MGSIVQSSVLRFTLAAFFLISVFSGFTFAADLEVSTRLVLQESTLTESGASLSASTLEILLEDREPRNSPCPYHLKRLEYLADAKLLLVDLGTRSFCPLDTYGKSAAKVNWTLPDDLTDQGRLTLIVNGSTAGIIEWSIEQARFDRSLATD